MRCVASGYCQLLKVVSFLGDGQQNRDRPIPASTLFFDICISIILCKHDPVNIDKSLTTPKHPPKLPFQILRLTINRLLTLR